MGRAHARYIHYDFNWHIVRNHRSSSTKQRARGCESFSLFQDRLISLWREFFTLRVPCDVYSKFYAKSHCGYVGCSGLHRIYKLRCRAITLLSSLNELRQC